MTMVIDFGLKRYFYDQGDEPRMQAVRSFVELCFTSMLREVFGTVPLLEDGRVLEVRREGDVVISQWLDDKQAAPILQDLRALFAKHDTFVSFTWDQTDEFNIELPHLAFWQGRSRVYGDYLIPGLGCRQQIGDFTRCWLGSRRHPQVLAAKAFLKVAMKHRLLLHTA